MPVPVVGCNHHRHHNRPNASMPNLCQYASLATRARVRARGRACRLLSQVGWYAKSIPLLHGLGKIGIKPRPDVIHAWMCCIILMPCHNSLHDTTPHYTTLHYSTLNDTTPHYLRHTTLRCTTPPHAILHDLALHYTTPCQAMLRDTT